MATPQVGALPKGRRGRRIPECVFLLVILAAVLFWIFPVTAYNGYTRLRLWTHGVHSANVHAGQYRIHYLVAGGGSPVVLIHGLGGDALNWAEAIPYLAQTNRVYAIDLLGFGSSEKPANADYSLTLQAQVVRDFLDSQHIRQADLVGVSMGGLVTLTFAHDYPDRIRRAVVSNSPGLDAMPDAALIKKLFPGNAEQVRELFRMLTPKPMPMPGFVARDLARRFRHEGWIMHRAVDWMAANQTDVRAKLVHVNAPLLLLWGKQDTLAPVSGAEFMRAQNPQSELVVLSGCGHIAVVDCAAQTNPEIKTFLLAAQPPVGVRTLPAQ